MHQGATQETDSVRAKVQHGDRDALLQGARGEGPTEADLHGEGLGRGSGFQNGAGVGLFGEGDEMGEPDAALAGDAGAVAGAGMAIVLHPAAQAALSFPSFHARSAYGRALVPRSLSTSDSMQLVNQQRRIRRPFNVDEVAALVDAVEVMGGRELDVAPLTSAWCGPPLLWWNNTCCLSQGRIDCLLYSAHLDAWCAALSLGT